MAAVKLYKGKFISPWFAVGEADGTFSVLRLLGKGIMATEERHDVRGSRSEAERVASRLNASQSDVNTNATVSHTS